MPVRLKYFLWRWLVGTLAALVAMEFVKGIHYDTWTGLLAATLLLGILNTFVRPLLTILSLPLMIATLGVFRLFINAGLLILVNSVVGQFHVDSFGAAFLGGLIISIVSLLLNSLTGIGVTRVEGGIKTPPPLDKSGDGEGPVIDV